MRFISVVFMGVGEYGSILSNRSVSLPGKGISKGIGGLLGLS